MKIILSNRKTLYFILSIVLVFVFTLTIAYAALNTVLKITGNAEVVASSWDIHLDNVQLVSGSATSNVPTIDGKTTASFTTTLTNPGDYYMFTIDVVNDGSIDAMIDSIEKLPQLNETQSKYLNYIVEYQSGESINTKQLVEANSFVRLKVKVEFRKDIVASDLPTTSETLNLLFKVNYVQSDETGISNIPNDGKIVRVVSGDYDTVGSEVCIKDECFYVISSTDETVTMLAKYNLHVGNKVDENLNVVPLENSTGKQDSTALASLWDKDANAKDFPWIGTVEFSSNNDWSSSISSYPADIDNFDVSIYKYVRDYELYLEGLGVNVSNARLIRYQDLIDLGCKFWESCKKFEWLFSSSYWIGSAYRSEILYALTETTGYFGNNYYYEDRYFGVRPVITISKSVM